MVVRNWYSLPHWMACRMNFCLAVERLTALERVVGIRCKDAISQFGSFGLLGAMIGATVSIPTLLAASTYSRQTFRSSSNCPGGAASDGGTSGGRRADVAARRSAAHVGVESIVG
jgi:hypothetical protein